MRKSRISFSISKKASKNEGDDKFPVADTPTMSSSHQHSSLIPSSYFSCRFCCKRFKSEKSYETHSKTKNHAKAVKNGSASELTKSRTCAGCHQAFETRPQLTDHCKRFSHMPMVQKTTLKNPVYGKAYTATEQEDPFVSIKYYSPYYCEVCDLDCVSDLHYQDHVKGTRHLKAMEKRAEQGRGVLVDLDTNEVDISEKCLVIMNKSEPVTETVSAYYCGICDTDCRSELAYTEHVTSKDHQIRMEGHGQMKISCDLCCMTFTSENNYKMHLRSKKHANNVAARQRLLPPDAQEPEKGESVHDLRDKIKRTLSPPLESFDKIKVNVATVESQDSAVRSVVINDAEIEAEEAPFMEMGRPNSGGMQRRSENGNNKDKKERSYDVERKLKEDEQEREKWAKKKAEDYAKKKATLEKSKGSEKDRPSRWDSGERRGSFTRGGGRGVRGRGRGRGVRGGGGRGGSGRGGGRFSKDDKYTWVKPNYDDNSKSSSSKGDSHKERYSKNDRKGDREDKGDKRDKRDSRSDRREKRRSYDDERDSKKYDSDSDSDYGERVILKKRDRKAERSPSTDDDGDDLRNVINKQRGKTKGSTEGAADFSDDYDLKSARGQAGGEDANNSLVFDYGHKPTGKGHERAELKGFFGGALSSIAGHFERPAYEGEELTMETERYYEEQRSAPELSRSQFSSRGESTLEETPPPKEDLTQNVEKTLLLELLKRQFPDIRYLTEQQGGLELMQRIFGEVGKAGGLGLGAFGAGIDFGGGAGGSIGGDGGSDDGGGKRDGSDGGRKVYSVADEVKLERGSQRRVLANDDDQDYGKEGRVVSEQSRKEDGKMVSGVGRGQLDAGKRSQGVKSAAPGETTTVAKKEIKSSRQKSPEVSKEKARGNKKEPEKSTSKDKRESRKEQKRSRSRSHSKDRRKRSRSRSSSHSRNKSKNSSSKRSRSSSRERSSSKKSKRTPSPSTKSSKKDDSKHSTKRKRSVSPKDGDKQKKTEKKNGAETKSAEESEGKSEKKGGKDKDGSVVSQMKAKSKDAKEKVLAKWTVSNWSGKEKESKKSQSEKEESVQKKTQDKDKKDQKVGSKRRDRRNEGEESSSSDKEQTSRKKYSKDRDERKVSSKQEPSSSRSKKTTEDEGEGGKKTSGATRKKRDSEGDKIFEDTSDYEEIDLDDIKKQRDLKKQFEDDYDDLPEAQVKRRRDMVDDRERLRDPIDDRERLRDPIDDRERRGDPIDDRERRRDPIDDRERRRDPIDDRERLRDPIDDRERRGDPIDDRERRGDPIDDRERRGDPIDDLARLRDEIGDRDLQALVRQAQQRSFPTKGARAETASPLGRGVPSVEEVRKSTLMSTEDAEFDPYSYEDRAFEAQEDAESPTELHTDVLASFARSGIPYQNLGYERFVTGQTSLASDYLSALGGMTATRESPLSRGLVQGRGLFPVRGLDPGYGLAPGHGLPPSLGLTPGRELALGGRLSLGRGLAPGSPLGLGRALAPGSGMGLGRGMQSTRGRIGRGRAVASSSRNNSALMYIQPTEDEDQGRQLRVVSAPSKQTVKSTSSLTPLGSRLAMSQSTPALGTNVNIMQTTSMAALRTISPVPLASRPAMSGKQERLPLKSSRLEQIQQKMAESEMSKLEEEHEDSYSEISDSDPYSSSKPLKSILKKQSKFTPVEVPRSQPSDAEVLSSGNLPKNVVGAEYVVQSTGEQGKFFCQLCDVQFTTLSAKNLHLRGPKHLAMFMKHKSPLIDQMIQRAMGGADQKGEEDDADTRDSENRQDDLDTKNKSVGEPAGRDWRDVGTAEQKKTVIKREPLESPHLMSEPSPSMDSVQQSRDTELEENLARGYPSEASSRPREETVHEPRLYIDEKTGRFIQAPDYYSESLSRKGEEIPGEYERSAVREEQYSQGATTRERDRREGSLGSARDDYGSLASREKYGQVLSRDDYGRLPSRERDMLARDEYDRLLPAEQGRGSPTDYDRPVRREGTAREEYGRLAAPDDYERLPARDDYDRFVRREDVPQARDDYRRSPTREQSLASSSDDLRQLPSREAYDRPPSRESFTNERDWQSARAPLVMRERTTDQRSDWSTGRSYDESRTVNEPIASDKRESSQYAASGKDKLSASREWTPGTASTKELAKSMADEPRKSASEQLVKRTSTDSATGFPRPEDKSEPPETVETRRSPERYGREDVKKRESPERYGGRSLADRREVPDSTYGQSSYREDYEKSYGGEERYRGRDSDYDSRNDRRGQSGYGNDTPRRGGYRGTRGRGGSNMSPRGGPRGRKPGFNRGRGQWKGGQGRY